MSDHTINLSPALYTYLKQVSLREPPVLAELRHATRPLTGANMQICPEQGQLMALLVELMGAIKALDIGTFTGYSALVVALALPATGCVWTFDLSKECTDIAQQYWSKAGVRDKIHLKLGPALENLCALQDAGEKDFDFAFIDADKANYQAYFEKCLQLLRPGGLILVDNVLWDGKVIDEHAQENNTKAIRAFNEALLHDERVTISMLPIGDGLTLARKR